MRWFTGMLILLLCSVHSSGAVQLTWVTDITTGGRYVVGPGTTFNETKPGIEIELYRMVAKQLGFEVVFKRSPWKECLQQIEKNQIDGLFPVSFKEERLAIGVYPMAGDEVDTTRKTRDNAYYLYTLASSEATCEDGMIVGLVGIVAVPIGWTAVEDLTEMNLTIREVPVHANSPDLLIQKRVDGFICLSTVFDTYLRRQKEKYQDVVKVGPPVSEKPYYLMLSRQFVDENPELAEKIWDTIAEIKKTDAFADLVNSYIE